MLNLFINDDSWLINGFLCSLHVSFCSLSCIRGQPVYRYAQNGRSSSGCTNDRTLCVNCDLCPVNWSRVRRVRLRRRLTSTKYFTRDSQADTCWRRSLLFSSASLLQQQQLSFPLTSPLSLSYSSVCVCLNNVFSG